MEKEIEIAQKNLCKQYGASFAPLNFDLKLGISLNVKGGQIFPINGLRHPPETGTSGWFIWAGEELLDNPDFFVPLHIKHLNDWCPELLKFLGLPPGYRFLLGENNWEDVWQDETLLNID